MWNGDFMVECPDCGFDNENDVKFCTECDSELNVEECPECGALNEAGDRFCEQCGTELGAVEEPPEKAAPEESAPPEEPKSKKKEKAQKKPPKKEKPKEETVVVVNMNFAQNEATKIATKQLKDDGGKLFKKKIEKIDAALLKYLPLIQASFQIQKKKGFMGLGGKETGIENLYFHGLTGKLLQVSEKLTFSDITSEKAENVKDFDGVSTFGTLAASMIPKNTDKSKVSDGYIKKKLMKLFGANLKSTKTVYLPVFKFKITNTKTKKARVLYVDSVFGIPTEKNPFKE